MPFTGQGTGIQNADDVFFSGVAQDNVLRYNNATSKWNNIPVYGFAAMAKYGGRESVATANATGATTLNLVNGNIFNITLTGNATLTFAGATNGEGCSFSLYLKQDGTGSRTVTWPAGTGTTASPRVLWSGGAPALSTGANAVDVMVFESIDGGANWYGSLVGTNFS